jgi:hypothetical protein
MTSYESFDSIAVNIANLGKDEVKDRIKAFRGRFRLDFSEDYLEALSVDRLRHILMAAMMTTLHKNAG